MSKTILAFEPDEEYAGILKTVYEPKGYTVKVIIDPAEGLTFADEQSPDVIYLSIELPQTSGFSICRKLRKNDTTRSIPLILVSNEATEETFEKHKKLKDRADEYLLKPFSADVITDIIDAYISESGDEIPVVDDDELDVDEMDVDDMDDMEFEEMESSEEFASPDEGILVTGDRDEEEEITVEDTSEDEDEVIVVEDVVLHDSTHMESVETSDEVIIGAPDAAPLTVVDNSAIHEAEIKTLQIENAALAKRIDELEKELESAQSEPPKRISTVPGNAREVLELRESLNRKDRELLDLKDAANSREKLMLDRQERITQLERANADLESKNITAEMAIHDLEENVSDLMTDKDVLTKKADDLQARIESQKEKIAKLESELDAQILAQKAEVARLETEKVDALAELTEDKEAEKKEALDALVVQLTTEKNQALEEQATTLKGQAADKLEEELTAQRLKHEAAIEDLTNTLNNEKEDALAAKIDEYELNIAELKDTHAKELSEYKSKLYDKEEEIGRLNAKLNDTQERLNTSKSENEELLGKFNDTEKALEETRSELTSTNATLEETRLELTSERENLASTQKTLETEIEHRKDTQQQLESTANELSQTQGTLEEVKNSLAETQAKLEETAASLSESEERRANREKDIQERDATIAHLEMSLTSARTTIAQKDELAVQATQALSTVASLLKDIQAAKPSSGEVNGDSKTEEVSVVEGDISMDDDDMEDVSIEDFED